MIVEALASVAGDLPGPLLTELAALYASDEEFERLGGDPGAHGGIGPRAVAAALADELAHPGAEVLLARSAGELVAFAVVLPHHPGVPATGVAARQTPDAGPGTAGDPDPWIGLLVVHAERRRAGHGRRLAGAAEARLRDAGRAAVRVAVPEHGTRALAFWTALGYTEIERGPDARVLRKELPDATGRRAARR
ncbi:GNAT family N-acetyltransferase [Streptomyces tremellae]|uniref:N-acetyltransferase domain-containing protein n=1 Tax=Streptomyces tremellae TaxID=1124239 RepID=A0ABP7FP42_9ACTN